MRTELMEKLKGYVDRFNAEDEELYPQRIRNADALEYLSENIPLLDCPDKVIEKTYYFRWWTLRKHWKETEQGHILTEFHPDVAWAGPNNSINAAAGHHLREARWLKDEPQWVRQYIRFWLDRRGQSLSYSMWYAAALEDYLDLHPDPAFEEECLGKLIALYEERAQLNAHPCGLYWSEDGRDAMELSISGSGIRPTLNSYMYGDACAIARMAARQGRMDVSEKFAARAEQIRKGMDRLLWDGDFYKVIPCERDEFFPAGARPQTPEAHSVREALGYIPWYFHLPGPERSAAFAHLMDEDGFASPFGVTTAERRHPRFMFKHGHECLWNGPVWPFATSQTLVALANHLRDHGEAYATWKDYYALLHQYAACHRIKGEDGAEHMWIDEDLDPFTGEWIARAELKADGWNPRRGGRERGKDYNHSTFCDLVLSGLLGIRREGEQITASPMIPKDWDHFMVSGLLKEGWTVMYDRDGSHYGCGAGLRIFKQK